MDCNEAFSPIVGRKEVKYLFSELINELWNRLLILQIQNLVSLTAFIVFNDLVGMENYIC